MRKAHAEHNEELCDLLLSNGKFNDWVVTTAFYSAVQFVKHEIFPCKLKDTEFNGFDEYYIFIKQQQPITPHKTLIKLVGEKMAVCKGHYRWLHDECHTSRYNNYIVSDAMAAQARNKLKIVKSYCKKK